MMFGPGLWGGQQSDALIIINPTAQPNGSTVLFDSSGNFDLSITDPYEVAARLTGSAGASSGATSGNGRNTYKTGPDGRLLVPGVGYANVGGSPKPPASRTFKTKWRPGAAWQANARVTFADTREHGFTGNPWFHRSQGFWLRFETATQEFVLSRRSGDELCRFTYAIAGNENRFIEVALYFGNVPWYEFSQDPIPEADLSKKVSVRIRVDGVTKFFSDEINFFSSYIFHYTDIIWPDVPFSESLLMGSRGYGGQYFNTSGSMWTDESYLLEDVSGHFFGIGIWPYETEASDYTPDNYPWG